MEFDPVTHLQYLRGSAFKAWHEGLVADQVEMLRGNPERYARQDIDIKR